MLHQYKDYCRKSVKMTGIISGFMAGMRYADQKDKGGWANLEISLHYCSLTEDYCCALSQDTSYRMREEWHPKDLYSLLT